MAYQSSRQHNNVSHDGSVDYDSVDALDAASQRKQEREQASQKALKTAAKGAGAYFGGPLGAKAVDMAANTKAGQKILNQGAKTLNRMPGMGRAADTLNKSGAIDAADKGIDLIGGGKMGKNSPNKNFSGGGQNGSLPSSSVNKTSSTQSQSSPSSSFPKTGGSDANSSNNNSNDESDKKNKGAGGFLGSQAAKVAVMILLPAVLLVVVVFMLVAQVAGIFTEYEDAFGISQTIGEETGNLYFESASKEQQDFYDRINNVKLIYQAMGKNVDALKVVAVYHVLNTNGADLDYNDMTEWKIMQIADSMFDGNTYNEETFKNNLVNDIFPSYLPNTSVTAREQMANDVLDYIERYYNLIGKDTGGSTCASSGSCVYDIKGYYIKGKGNVAESLQVSDLYVRLMQCGTGNGHNYGGTFGQPLEGEELVPFEKYILGVAYQEIGDGAPEHAFKAQLVAARSYILARHADMGGWRTLKQESDGKWVLQAAACTQDQVYCDPDQGCSATNGGQWGQVYSGLNHGTKLKGPMAEDSPYRTYANETAGEVLINSQGYIVYAGYLQTEQNKFTSLAKAGLNYKQILLQVYNQGSRNYGASDIQKNSCGGSSSGCVSTGDYANWKQYEGPWSEIKMGTSGKTIHQIGCLVTSVSMLIAKSGVQTNISDFNPGTFVEFLNSHGGFQSGGNFVWGVATQAAPSFKYQGKIDVLGLSREQKLSKLKGLLSQDNVYVVAEVKGNTGQHWVAIDSVSGSTINMMDPGSTATDMWGQYNWANTSTFAYYKVDR